MSLTHLSSPFSKIEKIEKIEKKQFPSPATKREIPRVETAVHSNGRIKENEIIIQSQELGDKKGIYNIKSLFDVTHGASTPEVPTIAPTPLQSDTLLFKRDPNVTKAGGYNNLDIRASGDQFGFNEPFIVKPIPDSGGDSIKFGYNRDGLPITAAADDLLRFGKFYTTTKGLAQIARENVTNFAIGDKELLNPLAAIMLPPIPIPMTGFLNFIQQKAQDLGPVIGSLRKPFKVEYSAKSSLGLPFNNLGDKPIGLGVLAKIKLPQGNNFLAKLARKALKPVRDKGMKELARLAQIPKIGKTPFTDLSGGGKPTRYVDEAGFALHEDDSAESLQDAVFEKGDFYVKIKDLRAGGIIYFRGFVTGITENITPSFNPIQYIGRSEDVYTYQKAERDLSFNLKVYPQNATEQFSMYKKLEQLTSLAYPEYLEEENNQALIRMKAPFTELYMAHIGTRKKGQFGFIKSLTYSVPEGGDWDALDALPRLFDIAISYQILSKRPPSLRDDSNFYGAYR